MATTTNTMNATKAIEILGRNRAGWELSNMKRALTMMSILNTDEENERLEAVTWVLRHKAEYHKAAGY